MKLPLSKRLLACAKFVSPGDRVADIGCDHGYLGIYLLLQGIASSMIEGDVNPGPLDAARRNLHRDRCPNKSPAKAGLPALAGV